MILQRPAAAFLAQTLQDQQQVCLFFRLKEPVSSDALAIPPSFLQPRQVGSSLSYPIKIILLVSATPVLNGGQGRACSSYLTDLPALDSQSFLGKMASLVGCVCVHSTIPHGQVPSDESVGAFEIVKETDFLVKSHPVQLEGQILLLC